MKAKGPTTQMGGVKAVTKSSAAPKAASGGKSTTAASGSKIQHHAPLHSDHKRSTKHSRKGC